MDTITIPPIPKPVDATVEVPGSKSITNRALLTAALADGKSILTEALFSEDTQIFAKCLRQLGILVEEDPVAKIFRVQGQGGGLPAKHADLSVGNAGTAARFITALVCLGKGGQFHFRGVERMEKDRPIEDLLKVLVSQGNKVIFDNQAGHMPYTIQSRGLPGGEINLEVGDTSQELSALLMTVPYAQSDTRIKLIGEQVSRSYIRTTKSIMEAFDISFEQSGDTEFFVESGQRYKPRAFEIEPDASAASYFFAAAAVTGGRVRIPRLTKHSCQGDLGFTDILARMGCKVKSTGNYTEVVGPVCLQGADADMNEISDTVQSLAAIAPFANSPTTIRNVAHIRKKETNRIRAVVKELRKMKVKVEEFNDGMKIYPGPVQPARICTYKDHRMAMSFAVTGLKVSGITIKNPGCVAKTFPDFFDRFIKLGKKSS
jgi:3-phosphoshikimate 1-carboxyvinyltransferase